MQWKKLGSIRVDGTVKDILVDPFTRNLEPDLKAGIKLLETLIPLSVLELRARIRAKHKVPYQGYNKYGLIWQVIEVEISQYVSTTLQHFVVPQPRRD